MKNGLPAKLAGSPFIVEYRQPGLPNRTSQPPSGPWSEDRVDHAVGKIKAIELAIHVLHVRTKIPGRVDMMKSKKGLSCS